MLPVCLIVIEGVLQTPTYAPIPKGILLYRGLAHTHTIHLASNYFEPERLEDWLKQENLTSHAKVHYRKDHLGDTSDNRVDQLKRLSRAGNYIGFVIESDPGSAKVLIGQGFDTLLCTYPGYSYPEWLPDYRRGIRPWAELEGEISRQKKLRAEDHRMSNVDLLIPDEER